MAKSAWIYQNTDPDLAAISKHGVDMIWLDPRSTNAAQVIQKLHSAGVSYGLYYAPSWDNWPSPRATAKIASAHLKRLGLNSRTQPIMFDLETQDVAWVRKFLLAWRVLRPTRSTAYTNAPFQGGYVPSLALKLARVQVYPQVYYGDMRSADGAAVVLELIRQGTPASMIHPFYDGAAIPADSRDGAIFTLERVPA